MAKAYTKEFIVGVYLHRFRSLPVEQVEVLYQNADKHYDKVGKDTFRIHAEVTAEAIREFKNSGLI